MTPLHPPTLKQLKYLCAVADHRHFGKAAQACFVSQSTLSAGILELEEILGLTLIERNNKSVQLTTVGIEIIERSRQILTAVDDLMGVAKVAQAPFTTDMKLGVIPTIAPFVLPQILKSLRKTHPQFKLFIREDLSEPLIQQLKNGQLDVLLLALPYPADNVLTQHLFFDDFLLAYEKNNSIGKKTKLKLTDLQSTDLLLLEDGHCLRDHAMDACRLKTGQINVPYQATSLNTIVQMVSNDIGITILPKMAVDAKILQGTNVAVRAFNEKGVSRSIGLMWRKKSARQAEIEELGKLILRL